MRKRIAMILAIAAAFAAIVGGAIAVASSDSEGGATGPEADRASQAALEATDGGTVNAVERDNEKGAAWEVEVTKTDGRTVDVRLDENYKVIVIDGDSESPDTNDGSE
jgi:hypothetical protein